MMDFCPAVTSSGMEMLWQGYICVSAVTWNRVDQASSGTGKLWQVPLRYPLHTCYSIIDKRDTEMHIDKRHWQQGYWKPDGQQVPLPPIRALTPLLLPASSIADALLLPYASGIGDSLLLPSASSINDSLLR